MTIRSSLRFLYIFDRSGLLWGVGHSRSKQRTDQRVLVLTLKILALKKTGFSPVKNNSQKIFDFCLPLFNATFQCRLQTLQYLKKNYIDFSQSCPAHSPELIFHIINMSQDASVSLSLAWDL
jgi:hypothetical protein